MSEYAWERTQRLLGAQAMQCLANSHVAVFGIGGVGGYAVEVLARSGVGTLTLVDHDRVARSNLNRQIFALHSTLGQYKVDAAAIRIADIAPDCHVHLRRSFFSEENAGTFDFTAFDFVIDAIDSVNSKISLILHVLNAKVPIISSMGAGNKLDASAFRLADLAHTRVCPLARVIRRELKRHDIHHLPVVYSEEPPQIPKTAADPMNNVMRRQIGTDDLPTQTFADMDHATAETKAPSDSAADTRRTSPGSVAFVPAAAGLVLGGSVVRALTDPHFHLPGSKSI